MSDEIKSSQAFRDVCLLVLGMAMGSERQHVINTTALTDYPNELQCIYQAVKSQQPLSCSEWLKCRGVIVEAGKTVRNALVDKVVNVRNKAKVQSMTAELRGLGKTEDPKEFIALMESCLQRLKGEIL